MDTTDPAPRVNFEALQHHVNRRVRLVGEVDPSVAGSLQALFSLHRSSRQSWLRPR